MATMRLGTLAALACLILGGDARTAEAQVPPSANAVKQAVRRLDAWLGANTNGNEWRAFLMMAELETQLAKPAEADPDAVAAILSQFTCGVAGLDKPKFVAVQKALSVWHAELARPRPTDLAALALAAKGSYVPGKMENAVAARTQLQNSIALLDRFLGTGANGNAWREYVLLDGLKGQLAEGASVDTVLLDKIALRFGSQRTGLSLPAFANVQRTLNEYRRAVYPLVEADLFDAKLDALAQHLTAFQQAPTADLANEIGRTLGWLEIRGQAQQVVAAVRYYYRHPNFFVQLSEPLVGAGMERRVNDTAPVSDVVLGTCISGTGWTSGKVTVDLVPYANWIAFDNMFNGRTQSRTVGRKGSARVDSAGTTTFQVRKRMYMNKNGFQSPEATAKATTRTQTLGVNAGRGGILFSGIANHIAAKRVAESKPQGQIIAAEHAEQRLISRAEDQAADRLATLNRRYNDKIRQPLLDRGQFPTLIKFDTTENFVYGAGLLADASQLGAPTAPPLLDSRADLCVRLHETAANNYAVGALAGRTFTQPQFEQWLRDNNNGKFPEWYKPNPRKAPWSITLDDTKPARVTFADGGFVISLRTKALDGVVQSTAPWQITAHYKLEHFGRGFAAVRQGEVEVVPPDFKPGDRMSARDITTSNRISEQFGEAFFKPRIERDGLTLPGEWAKAGKLQLVQMQSERGWILQSWKKP